MKDLVVTRFRISTMQLQRKEFQDIFNSINPLLNELHLSVQCLDKISGMKYPFFLQPKRLFLKSMYASIKIDLFSLTEQWLLERGISCSRLETVFIIVQHRVDTLPKFLNILIPCDNFVCLLERNKELLETEFIFGPKKLGYILNQKEPIGLEFNVVTTKWFIIGKALIEVEGLNELLWFQY